MASKFDDLDMWDQIDLCPHDQYTNAEYLQEALINTVTPIQNHAVNPPLFTGLFSHEYHPTPAENSLGELQESPTTQLPPHPSSSSGQCSAIPENTTRDIMVQVAPSRWECNICHKTINRKDRANSYRNTYQGVKQHTCNGKCGDCNCTSTFTSAENLGGHIKGRIKETCKCGKEITKKNIARHRKGCDAEAEASQA